jgi:cytochrome c556
MTRSSLHIAGILAGLMLSAVPPPAMATDNVGTPTEKPGEKDVVAYRRALMITLNEQSGALGMILTKSIPEGDAVAHLEAIALTASYATKAFAANVEGGEARPEVWTKWQDFARRMDAFAAKTAQAAKTARENGPEAGLTNILDALACKACHDIYRDEAKR